tara:strand:+ start:49 stop:468 length:420 start_codon:yes stop_codon:yes gene_type:complete
MYKNINLQFLISYIGFLPYLIVIIDKFFLKLIDVKILESFSIYYSIIILVFIGAINWDLKEKVSKKMVFYGVLPSFFSVFIIIIYLYNFNVLILLISYLLLQLFLDYFIIYKKQFCKNAYYFVRLPLTTLIVLSLIIIQ